MADVTYHLEDLTRLVRTKTIECECGCWYWMGSCDSGGYAKFKLRGKTVVLHRYSYEHLVGPIPDGMTIDHRNCTSRRCLNPAHMDVVSALDNTLRANATRWHYVKFDADGNAVDRVECPSCKQRDTVGEVARSEAGGNKHHAFSDAVADVL